MQIAIDNDTSPQVISAALNVSAGGIMSLNLQIPLSYAAAHGPIRQVYIDGLGGRVESQSRSGDVLTLQAHSKQGSGVLENTKYDPTYPQAQTLAAWLDRIAEAAGAATDYSADSALLASGPYTRGLSTGSPLSLLRTIAACYGMDVIHYSTTSGDVFKVTQPLSTSAGMIALSDLTALSYNAELAEVQNVAITKTAPIQQRVTAVAAAGRSTREFRRTTQGHPYLEGQMELQQIRRYWDDGRVTTFARDELKELDKEFELADWGTAGDTDTWYRSRLVYAPYFGSWLYQRTTHTKNYYDVVYYERDGDGDGWIRKEDRFESLPSESTNIQKEDYTHTEGSSTDDQTQQYGVLETADGTVYAHSDSSYGFTWTVYHIDGTSTTTSDSDSDSQDYTYEHIWPSTPYVFAINGYTASYDERQQRYLRRVYIGGIVEFWLESDRAGESAGETQPTTRAPQLYPWMATTRYVKASQLTQISEVVAVGETERKYKEAVTLTKALFDAGWNDTIHPPTIDEDFISLASVTLDKASQDVWFNPAAEPAADKQFMGLGLIGNIIYKGSMSSEKIVLVPGLQPGRMTVRQQNGQRQTYNIERAFSLYRLGAIAPVNINFIASSEKSFSVPQPQYRTGKIYNVSGTVWREPATASACLPYISRQHNASKRVQFRIPMALRAVSAALELIGTIQTLGLDRVYITAFTADYRTQMITYSGQVITDV